MGVCSDVIEIETKQIFSLCFICVWVFFFLVALHFFAEAWFYFKLNMFYVIICFLIIMFYWIKNLAEIIHLFISYYLFWTQSRLKFYGAQLLFLLRLYYDSCKYFCENSNSASKNCSYIDLDIYNNSFYIFFALCVWTKLFAWALNICLTKCLKSFDHVLMPLLNSNQQLKNRSSYKKILPAP